MIEIKNLNFAFGKGFSLKDIDLKLENGNFALLGSNGAGKTTLMRCLTGSYEYKGSITVSNKGLIGYLPQNIAFFEELTAREMLGYIYCVKGLGKKLDKAEINRCLDLTNLMDKADQKVKNLSGGMRRRLGVAQAILGDPEVLIFDEPTAGLDPEERMRFKNLIYQLNHNQDRVVIVSTHIVDDVVGNCKQMIVLKDGRVQTVESEETLRQRAQGKVFETKDNHDLYQQVYVEKNIQKQREEYIRVLTSTPQEGFELVEPTLEDGYLCTVKEI